MSATRFDNDAPIRIQRYDGSSQEDALRRFAADAPDAAAAGYHPSAQTWEGTSLLVTYARRESAQQSSGLLIPAGAVAAGGILVAAGSVMPWITATGGFGISVTRSGIEGGDGLITIVLGIGLALTGLAMVRGQNLRLWGASLLMSVVTLVLIAIDYVSLNDRIKTMAAEATIFASIGIGIWLVAAGGFIAAVASLAIRNAATLDRVK